jgi:hypothetical protein
MEQIKFEQVNGSADTLETTPKESTFYFVDFSKMNKVEDLVLVLSAMGFGIENKNPYFEQLKPFLNLDNPIKMPSK